MRTFPFLSSTGIWQLKIFLVCNSVEGIVLQETWHVLVLMMLKTLFNRKEANELCSKFGSDVFMAGEINSQLDFDEYYKVVVSFLTINKSSQNGSVIARFYQHSYSACKKLHVCPGKKHFCLTPSFVFLLGFFFRFAFGVEPQLIPCVQMVPTQSLSVAAGEGSWVLCTANTNRVILIDEFTRPVD